MADVRDPRASNAGWWIAAVVAVFALAGLVAIFVTENRYAEQQAAREQTAPASVETATVAAQHAAVHASRATQSAVDSTAQASQHAAAAAGAAADHTVQTAQTAGDAARDAAATEAVPQ
ncbi:hypothetical protein LJR219_002747 [Phenylobacterium sp. LjRoot219]|uniref:hypothetical protein n=1 Tax=Phenylobacterium sp. LjRoot219 TaxID=3342283 RepID=UPI003ED14FAA